MIVKYKKAFVCGAQKTLFDFWRKEWTVRKVPKEEIIHKIQGFELHLGVTKGSIYN